MSLSGLRASTCIAVAVASILVARAAAGAPGAAGAASAATDEAARAPTGEPPDAKASCANRAEQGQRDRQDGRLARAREAFVACAQDECPSVVRRACAGWLADVDLAIPTLSIVVEGGPADEVVVTVDGASVDTRAGRAVSVDPGPHVIEAAYARGRTSTRVVAVEGRKAEPVRLVFAREAATPPQQERRSSTGVRVGGIALVVGGGVALAASAALGLSARGRYDDARSHCAGDVCDPDGLAIRKDAIGRADVATGLAIGGLAAVTAGAILWLVFASR